MEDRVFLFLKDRSPKLCSFATASITGKTEISVMGYAVYENLSIIVSTKDTTRKIKHIRENPQTSFVVGWEFNNSNVQMDGISQIISEGSKYSEVEEFFFTQNPAAKKFHDINTVFVLFTPTWIRLTDPSVSPSQVEEKYIS